MNLTKLSTLIEKNKIVYVVVADLESGEIETAGDKDKLKYAGLAETLLGDLECIKALNESLKGQLMPREWGQGEISCLVCKPANNILIGLFYYEDRDPLASYNFGKDLDKQVKLIWNE